MSTPNLGAVPPSHTAPCALAFLQLLDGLAGAKVRAERALERVPMLTPLDDTARLQAADKVAGYNRRLEARGLNGKSYTRLVRAACEPVVKAYNARYDARAAAGAVFREVASAAYRDHLSPDYAMETFARYATEELGVGAKPVIYAAALLARDLAMFCPPADPNRAARECPDDYPAGWLGRYTGIAPGGTAAPPPGAAPSTRSLRLGYAFLVTCIRVPRWSSPPTGLQS